MAVGTGCHQVFLRVSRAGGGRAGRADTLDAHTQLSHRHRVALADESATVGRKGTQIINIDLKQVAACANGGSGSHDQIGGRDV